MAFDHTPGSAGMPTYSDNVPCNADDDCRSKLEEIYQEKIKRAILDGLGIASPPNITRDEVETILAQGSFPIQSVLDDDSKENGVATSPPPKKATDEMLTLPEEGKFLVELNCSCRP